MLTIPPSAQTIGDPPAHAEVRAREAPAVEAAGGRARWLSLPGGLIASLLCHAFLILWAIGIFEGARPLAAVPAQSISVDLVSEDEARKLAEPAKPVDPDKTPKSPDFDPLRPSLDSNQAGRAPMASATAVPDTARAALDEAGQKVALAARLADALQLPIDLPGRGAEDATAADAQAKLEQAVITVFKTHLNKCWTVPAGTADVAGLKVLIRVVLNRDGTFSREPMLIQAVASTAGPALVRGAMRALQRCQPYSFMPADQYNEWKVLDLAFSPQGIL